MHLQQLSHERQLIPATFILNEVHQADWSLDCPRCGWGDTPDFSRSDSNLQAFCHSCGAFIKNVRHARDSAA